MSIDQTKLLSLLNEVLNQQAVLRLGGNEATYKCPVCNHENKRKLEISLHNNDTFGYYHCWTCNLSGKSFRSLFKKLNAARTYFTRLYDITKDKRLNVEPQNDIKKEDRKLPDTFLPILPHFHRGTRNPHARHAVEYLYKRNITEEDVIRYNIGYVEDGEYSGRIIIPSYDKDGNLNFFSSRAFYDSIVMKHKNPNWGRDIIGFELFVNWSEPITIVESVFNAITIRRNSIPLFGKIVPNILYESMLKYGTEVVNVCLDKDAEADSIKICEQLISLDIQPKLVILPKKDPNEIGFFEMSKLIKNAVTPNFSFFLMKRMS